MYLLKHSKASGVITNFEIEESEDGLMIYEACINYILNKCSDQEILEITRCNREELTEAQKHLITILFYYADKNLLDKRYFDPKNRHTDQIALDSIGVKN